MKIPSLEAIFHEKKLTFIIIRSDFNEKMKTLFKRQFEDHKVAKCLNEVEPECKWVLDRRRMGNRKTRRSMLLDRRWKNIQKI